MNTNYRTLHKDIGLIQRSNDCWDLWFDNGDLVSATDFHSLQVGIILACLTSWNYMNRYGNPTYQVFGNRAYELLKANKSSMVKYKIQQYFIECLKRMRRVYEIVYLEVNEVPNDPHKYFVEFEVISISNQLIDGSFTVSTDTKKSSSYIDYEVYMPYASNENELIIDLWLKNEYGGGLGNEILYMYLQKGNGEYELASVVGQTDNDGYVRVTYKPTESNENNTLYFDYRGNNTYNSSTSKRTSFKTELFDYDIQFLDDGDNIDTTNNKAKLHLRLKRKSELTNEWEYFVSRVTVLDEKNNEYTEYTDENGETTIEVNITEDTTFTTQYHKATDSITVTYYDYFDYLTNSNHKNGVVMTGTVTYEDEGAVLESTTFSSDNYQFNFRPYDDVINVPYEVSFDLLDNTSSLARLYFYNDNFNGSAIGSGTLYRQNNQPTHIKFVVRENNITRYIGNNATQLNLNTETSPKIGCRFGYWQPTSAEIKIANFKIKEL